MTVQLFWGAVVLGGSAIATAAQLPALINRLQFAGVEDIPNERSSHSVHTVRGGGLAMVAPAVVTVSLLPGQTAGRALTAVGLLLISLTGFADDVRGLSVSIRLAIQAFAAVVLVLPIVGANVVVLPAALLVISSVNAFNFMDGINGISGITLLVAGVAYGSFGAFTDTTTLAAFGFLAAGLGTGFLPFNFPNARVFLGDAGSYLGGAILALAALSALHSGVAWLAAIAPLAVYGADTFTTLVRRTLRGEKVGAPHREHSYQRLAALVGHSKCAIIVGFFTAALVVVAALPLKGGLYAVQIFVVVAIAAAFVVLPEQLERHQRLNE